MASLKGHIKHSLAEWCFCGAGEQWPFERLLKAAVELGVPSIELCDEANWPALKDHGLTNALVLPGMPGAQFMTGFNNMRYREQLMEVTTATIKKCEKFGFPNVLAFTGYKYNDAHDPNSGEISKEECAKLTIDGLKKIAPIAEAHGVTMCLEHLNTRDDTHPMKGHPGYQGDDLDFMSMIVREVNSPNVKLLFDIYHVQVMHGDVIRRLRKEFDIIGHIHTAGCPGRNELNDKQEINFPAIMNVIVELGYKGYVGHEFIPTGDTLAGIKQAVALCDV